MGKRTPLYEQHQAAGAKIVDFAGWDMPLNYGSQLDEHHLVRRSSGMFDVSHMAVVDLRGDRVRDFLQELLANDVGRLQNPGKALYSCMLNDAGGVIDDLIVYLMQPDWFRMVVNAGTREKDLAWIRKHADGYQVQIDERTDLAMVAVQGPEAREKAAAALPEDLRLDALELKRFQAACLGDWFVARTGYTGEDGFEVVAPASEIGRYWEQLTNSGVSPIGLGARDTLRLEAGMNLYGSDMDENVTPVESGLMWTVALEPEQRAFIGRAALVKKIATGKSEKFIGLVLQERGMLRNHMRVVTKGGDGEITSGGFSPTLGKAIAFARVKAPVGEICQIEIRGKLHEARVVKPPFVRDGKSCID